MPDLLLAPYIPLSATETVGPWQLVPFKDLEKSEALPNALRNAVLRLVEAYRVDAGGGSVLGAVVHPAERQIGEEVERSQVPVLRNTLLAGLIVENPEMAKSEDEQVPNAGHACCTSENAVVYGHPQIDPQSYVIQTGQLCRVTSARTAEPDEALPKVEPPVELPTPMFASFDVEFAEATCAALTAGDEEAQRLDRTLGWYFVAFSNADAVVPEVRVGAVRSALEVLTGVGDRTKDLVRAVGELLAEPDEPQGTYEIRPWKGPVQLTGDEWWLARLCDLRNRIFHGDEVPPELWEHEGQPQLDIAHDALIRCLREKVADAAGDPLLLLRLGDRATRRIAEELAERYRAAEGE